MKFFTKEWYQTMQNTGLGCLLEVETDAEKFSETYYRRLYHQEKEKWLFDRAEICEYLQEPFDKSREKKLFDMARRIQRQQYELNLPEYILEKIADIRVLALNRCSKPVKEMIDSFAEDCKNKMEKVFEDYQEYECSQFSDSQPHFLKKFMFHDSRVLSMRKKGNNYLLSFEIDADDDWSVKRVIFENATILKKEKQLAGAWWLYEEVHKTQEGYEICILFYKNGLFEVVLKCDNVILE